MCRFVFYVVFIFVFSPIVQATAKSETLVCFFQDEMLESLQQVDSMTVSLRSAIEIKKHDGGSCHFSSISSKVIFQFLGFWENGKGFIFPVFAIRYPTSQLVMFTVDGVFLERAWVIEDGSWCRASTCLVAKKCQYISGNYEPPPYISNFCRE